MQSTIRKIKNIGHLALAISANAYNKFPSRGLFIIGVTGTDGKTTTANLIYEILRKSGRKVAVISTLGAVIDGMKYETGFHVTTPSPFAIQKYLKIAKKKGCTHIVIEVTSHALDQNRINGLRFDIAVLTNITHEHLDYHKTYEKYVQTKLKLLKKASLSIVNSNGEWFYYVKEIIPNEKLITYSLHGVQKNDLSMTTLPYDVKTSLIGDFNLENVLAASATAIALNIPAGIIEKAVYEFEPPIGRQEIFRGKNGAMIMVDFAHTPNSFERILPTVRKKITGRLIHVFGSAGERDKGKRSEMGKVASFYDDVIILTAEDSRSEKVENINKDIRDGINLNKEIHEITDRMEAIEFAISMALPNDAVVITGKGHERSMNLGNGEVAWSDQEAVLKAIGR